MDVTPERVTIIGGLLALFGLGKAGVWSWGREIIELKASHERERLQWEKNVEQLRAELARSDERNKILFELAIERREIVARAVDLAVAAKA